MSNTFKIKLYILSLAFLFLIIFVMTISIPDSNFNICNSKNNFTNLVCYKEYTILFISKNHISLLMIICMVICWYIKHEFDYFLKGGGEQVIKVVNIKSEDYEHLTFLATYIIPFFGFTFDDYRKLFSYLLLLIIIGAMLIKTNKYYVNPTLAILGFRLYKANLADQNGLYESIIIISRDIIKKDDIIKYKIISENVFYAKNRAA